MTDEKGYFDMPAIFDLVLLARVLPMQFVVPQHIYVDYSGEEHEIWSGVKERREENSEGKGKPIVVTCDLKNERILINLDNGSIFTKCRWDIEPDPIRTDWGKPIPDHEI